MTDLDQDSSMGLKKHPESDTNDAARSSVLRRLLHIAGVDRAIAFTVLARSWSTVAGLVTVLLIARFLTPIEQGYYYTFSSLVALQIVFELGFSFVILQMASHERVHLTFTDDYQVTGDTVAYARLASVLQVAVRWYSIAAVLMAMSVMPAGFYFFAAHQQHSVSIAWKLPWVFVVLAAVFTFQIDPILSFIEGCGEIAQIARMRWGQAVAGSTLAWIALVSHHGLYAPAMLIGGRAIVGSIFLYSRKKLLLPLLRFRSGEHAVNWRSEILPFQWRIAVSWLCGYFIFQIFNPVLFAYRGPAAAGRMGMSLSITAAVSAIAIAWIDTKAAPFGNMVAKREFAALDRTFFRTLIQSGMLLASGAILLLVALALAERAFPQIESRVLPEPLFAVLLGTALLNHVVFSEAIYLRAHKQEPFLYQAILVAMLTTLSTLIAGRFWGAAGITIGYFFSSGVVGLTLATIIFLSKRREWHGVGTNSHP